MKKSDRNLDHQIQLKKDEIERYKVIIERYSLERREKFGKPYIDKLYSELQELRIRNETNLHN